MTKRSPTQALRAMAHTWSQIRHTIPIAALQADGWQPEGSKGQQSKQTQPPADRLQQWLLAQITQGNRTFESAEQLARRYQKKDRNPAAQVAALVRGETSRGFAVGFAAGLVTPVAAAVAIPASLLVTWLVQARMVAAIAVLLGHSLDDPWTKATILLALDDTSTTPQGLSERGVPTAQWAALGTVKQAAAPLLRQVQKRAASTLWRKASNKPLSKIVRGVPILGAMAGASLDAYSCLKVAQRAQTLLMRPKRNTAAGQNPEILAAGATLAPHLPGAAL